MSAAYSIYSSAATRHPAWVPGLIEVEFRHPLQPAAVLQATGRAALLQSHSGDPMPEVNAVLVKHGHLEARPCFRITAAQADQAQASAAAAGFSVPHHHNFLTLRFPPASDTRAIVNELAALPDVVRAVPVPTSLPPSSLPADPLLGRSGSLDGKFSAGLENQWYLFRCKADRAWTLSTGRNVVVANIDWGFLVSHVDLAPNLELQHAYSELDQSRSVSQGTSINHGTAATGLLGAAANGQGIVGFAFQSAIWPVQANAGGSDPVSLDQDAARWARAIEYVRLEDSGGRRKVINFEAQTGSLGNFEMMPSVSAAIRHALAAGIPVCVPAGNGNRDAGLDDQNPPQPIPDTGSILVAATAYDPAANPRWSGSNWGARIVVSAPGDPGSDVTCDVSADASWVNSFGGTSGATPKVSGTVALMLSANPALTAAQVRAILASTGSAVTTTADRPAGVFLDSEAAVRAAIAARSSAS